MAYEGLIAETVRIWGHDADEIDAYLARPLGVSDPLPGVVLLHHAPGYDEWAKEITRRFAHNGYLALLPDLHYRYGPGTVDEKADKVRAAGGVPDDTTLDDVSGAMRYLRALPQCNGKIGLIGFCAGGRQTYMVAGRLSGIDAAVDCWGGRVVARPDQRPATGAKAPIEYTSGISCPILGIFGADDRSPSPEDVAVQEAELKKYGIPFEHHSYPGAGHSFWTWDRPSYRAEQFVDSWEKTLAFFGKHLATGAPASAAAAGAR